MNQQQKQFKILLIGDSCIDKTYYGRVDRLSPEAPIPVLDYSYNRVDYGMTYNVYNNFINLGFNKSNIILDTSTYEVKKRYVDIKSKQQLLRVDSPYDDDSKISIIARINKLKTQITRDKKIDAIVISDYDKGHVTYELVEELKNNYIGPIFIDTKKPDLKRFQNCIIKINDKEYENRTSWASGMIVTYGGDMVTYKDKVFTPPNVEAFDACGCGDTFLAALVYHYLKTNHTPESIRFAMKAAAVTVKHLGVYAPTLEEIKNDSN